MSLTLLSLSGLEADNKEALGSAVADILRVVLSHSLDASRHIDNEARSSLVHCGRTKVFLTNSMVSAVLVFSIIVG